MLFKERRVKERATEKIRYKREDMSQKRRYVTKERRAGGRRKSVKKSEETIEKR